MPSICPKCDASIPEAPPCECKNCGHLIDALPPLTSFSSQPMEGGWAEGTNVTALPDEGLPSIVKREAELPYCPAPLLLIGSILLCAMQGAAIGMSMPGGVALNSETVKWGAIAGFLIGIVLAIDLARFQRQLLARTALPSTDKADEPVKPPAVAKSSSEWIPMVMLVLPAGVGLLQWFGVEGLFNIAGSAVIVITAVLGYFSTREMLLRIDRHSTYHGAFANPAFVYLSILFFWLFCYPVHFVIRWHMGGRNLIVPALIAMALFVSPMAKPFLVEADLPSAADAQVLPLLKQMLESEPMMRPVTLAEPIELLFDEQTQARICQCVCQSASGVEKVKYKIDWQNRGGGLWQIHLLDRLPMVDTPDVRGLVQQMLEDDWFQRRNRLDLAPLDVLRPTQTRYDAVRQQRAGSAVARTPKGDVPITFVVEWHQPDRKLFHVQVQGNPP